MLKNFKQTLQQVEIETLHNLHANTMRNLYLGRIDEENEKGAGRYKNVIIQHQENERLEELLDQYDCQLLSHGVQPSPTEYRIYCVDEDLEKMSRFLIQNYGMRTEIGKEQVDEMSTFVAMCTVCSSNEPLPEMNGGVA